MHCYFWGKDFVKGRLDEHSFAGRAILALKGHVRSRGLLHFTGCSAGVSAREASLSATPSKQDLGLDAPYSVPAESIHVVDSFAALEAMQQHIFACGTKDTEHALRHSSQSSQEADGSSQGHNGVSAERALVRLPGHTYQIVGLDTEWQSTEGFWPVSVFQVSTRTAAFLIDMTWFCRPAPAGWSNSGTRSKFREASFLL